MKKLLLIAILMLALVITAVACTEPTTEPETSADDVTTAETPTEAPSDEPDETPEPEVTTPDEPEDTTLPEESETPEPDTKEPDTTEPETHPETEPETADPADPVWIMDADALSAMTNVSNATVEKNEAGYASFTATAGDPWFLLTGNIGAMPEYLVMRYRTNTTQQGEFFIGNGANPVGGESFKYDYNANSEWNLLIFHLPTVAPYMADNTVGYIRFDFYTGGPEDGAFLDVEYVAFFNTAEYAQAYDFELHKAPMWTEKTDLIKHQSFDQLYAGYGEAGNGPENVFEPGQSASWDFTVNYEDYSVETLTYWGWIGYMGELGQFGYQINGGSPVYNAEWAFVGADHEGIIGAAQSTGADSGTRMKIAISIAGLQGTNSVRALYKTADGVEICLNEFTVNLPAPVVIPDTAMNVTVNAADNFAADAAVDATVNLTDSNLKNIFTTVTHAAGDQGVAINAADGAYYKAQGFSEAFVPMDGTYAYTIHSTGSAKKQMASFFVRGTQVVHSADLPAPEPDNGLYPINNYYETDGKSNGHAGAGIQLWNHKRLLLGVKYYDESAKTRVGTAYWLIEIDCQNKDVQVIDTGDTVYVTVDGVLAATVELIGSGKAYDSVTVGNGATFCEKAIVTFYCDINDDYGFTPDENNQYVIENTLVVDTPLSDVGVATRTGTLKFSSLSIAPLSSVEIPKLPGEEPDEPAPEKPTFPGNAGNFSVCADNVRAWVGGSFTDLCTQEAHKYLAEVGGLLNVDGLEFISFRGWANPTVGGIEIDQFGYQIGMNEPVFSADFWKDEPDLNNALNSPVAKRYENIKIPVADLANGTYDLYLLVKDTAGVIYCMNGSWGGAIQIQKTDAPEPAQDLVVDLTAITPNASAKFEASWAAAGFSEPVIQMMNYGSSISLGEIDLSKYSAVVVTYGSDASAVQGDVGTFLALTKNGAVEDASNNGVDAAEIIAQATMSNAAGGWTVTRDVTIAIDSDYVGEVHLAQDMKDTNGIAITSIVFIAK